MPPRLPVSPNIPLNIVLSILLGCMLGLALAVLTELSNRRVRSAADLGNALPAPVLGVGYALLLAVCLVFAPITEKPFIYFQF